MALSRRRKRGNVLVEAMCGLFIFIPLAFFVADLVVMTHTAQVNEEFAEQLARLCATLQTKDNAQKACKDVIKQYVPPANVSSVNLDSVLFDVATRKVTIATSMTFSLPVPMPGNDNPVVRATVTQPIVAFPAAQ